MHKKVQPWRVLPACVFFFLLTFLVPSIDASAHTISGVAIENGGTLKLDFEDSEEVSNACDLSIERFEYLSTLDLLIFRVHEATCPLDRVGKGKTSFRWTLPMSLRAGGTLHILLNGSDLFELKLKDAKANVQHIKQ